MIGSQVSLISVISLLHDVSNAVIEQVGGRPLRSVVNATRLAGPVDMAVRASVEVVQEGVKAGVISGAKAGVEQVEREIGRLQPYLQGEN